MSDPVPSPFAWKAIPGAGWRAEHVVKVGDRVWRFVLGLEEVAGDDTAPAHFIGSVTCGPRTVFRAEYPTMGEALEPMSAACLRAFHLRWRP